MSFEVERGKAVAIVGQSGSGKSTCLRLVNRLLDADSVVPNRAGQLDDAEMRRLNAAIDIDQRAPKDVASELVNRLLATKAKKLWLQKE